MILPPALRVSAFRSLWTAGLVSDTGDWMLLVALPIVVYAYTRSAMGTAAAFLIELVPGIVLAPRAGRLADRVDRRRLMVGVNLLQALGLAPLLFVSGRSSLAWVYAVLLIQSALSAFFDPAKNAQLPTLLPADELVSGNSLIALGTAAGRVVGGPLGGLLVATGSLRLIAVLDAATFVVAAALIARPPSGRADVSRPCQPPRTSAAAPGMPAAPPGTGVTTPGTGAVAPGTSPRRRATLRRAPIRAALGVTFLDQVAQGIFVVLFIVFVSQRLHGGAGEIGLLRGVQAIGAAGAGLILGVFARRGSPARLTVMAALAFGVLSLAVWNAPVVTTATPVYVALFIAVGAPGVIMETGLLSFVAQHSADGERGPIFGALIVAENGGRAVGMVVAGVCAGATGLEPMLDGQGALFLAAGALAAVGFGCVGGPSRLSRLWSRRSTMRSVPSRRWSPHLGRETRDDS